MTSYGIRRTNKDKQPHMKYILSILLLAFFAQSLQATLFNVRENEDVYLQTINKFDVDASFLQDKILISKLNKFSNDRKKEVFLRNLDRAYLFIPILMKKIELAGIPEEFLYLAMAESNFKTTAYSHKKAAGLWQFLAPTGRKYGLRIDDYVDERKDILKSTDAAIAYLKDLHGMFGKWYLAAMAYNCGEGRVRWAIRKAGTDDLSKLLQTSSKKRRQFLPRETRNYIRKILSFALIMQETGYFTADQSSHLLNRGMTMPIVTRSIPANVHMSDVSDMLNMKYKDLTKLNPHLRYNITPPNVKTYNIYVPYSRLAFFNTNKDKIKPSLSGFRIHTVKRGDTLYDLARAFGITVNMIKLSNELSSNMLRIKQKLLIPIGGQYLGNHSRRQKVVYRVKAGDTLSGISQKFKTKMKDIMRQNELRNTNLQIGDKLVIYN